MTQNNMDQKNFWEQFGMHMAIISAQIGEEVGLALLSGFLSKKLGTPIVIQPTPIVPPTQ